jgi:hypothetical protein
MQGFGLEDATPVKLRTARTISSADAHTGDTLDFEVLEDVQVHGAIVIPKGGIAWGTVTDAQPKRRMARGGKLDVNIDSVRLTDGEKFRFARSKRKRRRSHRSHDRRNGRHRDRVLPRCARCFCPCMEKTSRFRRAPK